MKRCLSLSLVAWALGVASWSACGDQGSLAGANDTSPGFDGTTGDTASDATSAQDTSTQDTSTTSDTTVADSGPDVREVTAALFGLKDDPTYLVPGNIAPKTGVVAAGDLVAWVEGAGTAPVLVVWDVATPDVAPRSFAPPTLAHPRALALSDAYLAYVDDRYGDPDIFAIDLVTGAEVVVVNRPGAQEAPAILGARVAWEDCSSCVTGDGVAGHEPGREIIERELPTGDELARTSDAVADRAPTYGLLADGRPALAWISGRATLRLERIEPGVSATRDVSASLRGGPEGGPDAQEVGRVAVWGGMMAWRPSPFIVNPDSMIVNPDSMYPADVFKTDPSDGTTTLLTTHAEIAARMDLRPLASSARLAWLEIPPGVPGTGRVMVSTGAAATVAAEAPGVTTFALGRNFVVFSAPRTDNDGNEDVQVLRLDLP